MNQIVTGKFIADVRKKKNLTQRELADELNISDKTVSKWETGNGFPEISLMLPLCKTLEISVNELLTGEHLTETQYKEKAEENMVNMIREREENAKKMKMTIITGLLATISFITLLLIVAMYEQIFSVTAKITLISIAFIVFGMGLYVAMQAERTIGYYHCKKCDEYFVPSFGNYFVGIHTLTRRYLFCPKCKKKHWCKKVLGKPVEKQ